MAEAALARKLKRKPGARAAILYAPPGYQTRIAGMPRAAEVLTGTFDWIQIFVRDQAQLKRLAPKAPRALGAQGLLWISFPKGASRIQTERRLDLKWVALISVDETWSAFALRLYKPGEARTQVWS